MTSIDIRKATQDDLPAILSLYSEIEAGGTTTDLAHARVLFARMQTYPNYHVYIASDGGAVVGTFALLVMDNLAHMGAPSGVVEDVAVASARQGQGIGKEMMRFAMEQCRKAGCYKLALSSNMKRDGAHRFYDALGFERHGYSFVVANEHE